MRLVSIFCCCRQLQGGGRAASFLEENEETKRKGSPRLDSLTDARIHSSCQQQTRDLRVFLDSKTKTPKSQLTAPAVCDGRNEETQLLTCQKSSTSPLHNSVRGHAVVFICKQVPEETRTQVRSNLADRTPNQLMRNSENRHNFLGTAVPFWSTSHHFVDSPQIFKSQSAGPLRGSQLCSSSRQKATRSKAQSNRDARGGRKLKDGAREQARAGDRRRACGDHGRVYSGSGGCNFDPRSGVFRRRGGGRGETRFRGAKSSGHLISARRRRG